MVNVDLGVDYCYCDVRSGYREAFSELRGANQGRGAINIGLQRAWQIKLLKRGLASGFAKASRIEIGAHGAVEPADFNDGGRGGRGCNGFHSSGKKHLRPMVQLGGNPGNLLGKAIAPQADAGNPMEGRRNGFDCARQCRDILVEFGGLHSWFREFKDCGPGFRSNGFGPESLHGGQSLTQMIAGF